MNEAEEDKKRRQSKLGGGDDDADLAKALKLSKEEEELRRRELEESNAQSLFDDTPAPSTQPQYTGFNQGYQQQGAVDWFGNPVEPQQPQSTGYLNNAYSQFQPQQTGFQNGFQPQQTGFDQFGQPQANFMQPQQTIQPQQTAFNGANPYAQQQLADFAQFQPQQQQSPVAGNHNPWATNQPPAADALKPAPTGSNNPFASGFGRPQPQQQKPIIPTLSSLAEERASNQFNQPSYNPITNFSAPQPPQQPQQIQPPKEELDPQRARLNALLASGTGMDTFGNTGEMRVPSHFTAGGNFVNSAGSNLNKMTSQATGNNPFFTQKFTGAPQQHPGFGQPQNTGFGGGFGQTNNNPFGAQGGQQRPQQGGSLIDL
jgi:epsin